MGNLHLVTGYAGQPHVTAADQGSFVERLIREGEFVMEAGTNFAASIVSNNQIRVGDGEMMMQGRHVKLAPGAYVDLTIENGAQGYLRRDLIVVRYTKNFSTGIEECSLVVLKGAQAENNPSDPEYSTGNLNADGAQVNDFPLYRVPLSGLNVGNLEKLFEPQKSIFDSVLRLTGGTMAGNISMAGYKVSNLGTPISNGDAVPLGYANQKFAPSGYGLGSDAVSVTDANDAVLPGWYQVQGANTPSASIWWDIFVVCGLVASTEGAYSVKQFAFDRYASHSDNGASYLYRSKAGGGAWTPWEWVNPPMYVGTEYRTTDRYNGAAVYKKVDTNGNILWRKDGESQWHLLASADYVATATVE